MSTSSSHPAGRALLIGNSDGIGLALARRLVADGWSVASLSRSPCSVDGLDEHVVSDVRSDDFSAQLAGFVRRHGPFDLCVYLVATANDFDPASFKGETAVFEINLLACVRTMAAVVPSMVQAGRGHFIGVSSLADDLLVEDSPAYPATKVALSNYLTGCAKRLRKRGVAVTNLRLGFVDTKLAKAPVRPMLATTERAVELILHCVKTRPVQMSWPKTMGALVRLGRWLQRPGVWFGRG